MSERWRIVEAMREALFAAHPQRAADWDAECDADLVTCLDAALPLVLPEEASGAVRRYVAAKMYHDDLATYAFAARRQELSAEK